MKYIKIIILIISIFFITGCWNYRELNEISIITAMGIDVSGDEIIVSVDIVNPTQASNNLSGSSKLEETPTTIYQYKGKTIREAINNIVFEAPYQLYTGHMSLLVISEKAAKKGIYDYIDYFMADTEIRKIFPVVVVENGTAADALKIVLPLNTITAENMKASLEATAKFTGYVGNRKFDEIINSLYMEGRHPTISSVKIKGSPDEGEKTENVSTTISKNSIIITGSAVFKEDKLVGYLHDVDSLGYTILRGYTKTIEIEFPCDNKNNYASAVVDNVKTKIKTTIKKRKPFYEIMISGESAIPEYNCKLNSKNMEKSLNETEKNINDEIKKIIDNTLTKLQNELKSDVVGFGERLYKEKYKYWKTVKKDWDIIFTTTEYKIKTKVKIVSIDTTLKPAKEK